MRGGSTVGRRRGFFAELQHQARVAEQRRQREHAAAVRAHNQAVREAERARQREERARAALSRAQESERRAAEAAALRAYRDRRVSEAEAATARYAEIYDQIDTILAATLDIDDYVDLESLRRTAEHPEFAPGALATPVPHPAWVQAPPEPQFTPPPEPAGLGKLFGKNKHEQQVAAAHQQWQQAHAAWLHHVQVDIPAQNQRLQAEHQGLKVVRQERLSRARADYEEQCRQREAAIAEHNARVDDLIARLAADQPAAIDEYVGIVLSNSTYPDEFPVDYDYTFDGELRELTLSVTVPAPDTIPSIKQVKYIAASDEIRETPLSQKDQRQRYNTAVTSVALRTLHEIFEADRAERIESISMTVATVATDPATGHPAEVPFVAAAVSREQFLHLNLAEVEPAAALTGLRALVSKNPFALTPIATSSGVRR
ncbi:hypothetical protein [Nocardia aobensis]|uniref:hypothetical protein n=1 Tax=Nocardia aobensis TaxID=257277 RepID=UPI0012F63CDB|nr:hypothetical protein [Nocardia aobensis]